MNFKVGELKRHRRVFFFGEDHRHRKHQSNFFGQTNSEKKISSILFLNFLFESENFLVCRKNKSVRSWLRMCDGYLLYKCFVICRQCSQVFLMAVLAPYSSSLRFELNKEIFFSMQTIYFFWDKCHNQITLRPPTHLMELAFALYSNLNNN